MVSCAIGENEIAQMGYQVKDLYKDKDLAGRFMREVYDKAKEIGFQIGDYIQTVQVAVTQNHQFILNFIEMNPEEQINETINNLLDAAEAVEFIGKDRLEEILAMSGKEKCDAFQECMVEIRDEFYKDGNELEQDSTEENEPMQIAEVNVQKKVEESTGKQALYFLCFEEFSKAQEFAKHVFYTAPGRMYKDNKMHYVLLVDIGELSLEKQGSFIFLAEEYVYKIHKGTQLLTYFEEHAEVLIKNDPIVNLRKI